MATPKKPTRAELEKRLQKAQADLLAMKRRTELDNTKRPVLYLMRANKDANEYIVGSSESLKAMPEAPTDVTKDADGIYYKSLDVGADFSSLAAELERCLARFKSSETGANYAVSFEEGKMWVDFVAGRAILESMTDIVKRQEFLRRIVAVFADAERVSYGLQNETDESDAGADSVGASPPKTKDAKKTEEKKKIAAFVIACCVLDADAPLVKKEDLLGMYRIWAKGTTFNSNSLMVDYLKDELKVKMTHIGPSKDGIIAFKGISLKMDDWKYTPTPDGLPVKRFLQEKCVFAPAEKVFSRTLFEEYRKWREDTGLSVVEPNEIKRQLRDELKVCPITCMATYITIGSEAASGWHGVGIVGANRVAEEKSVRNVTFRTGRTVERRIPGGEVLDSWPSLAQATRATGIPAYKIQKLIQSAKPDDEGAIFVFADGGDGASAGGDGASTSGASTSGDGASTSKA